MPAVSEKQRKLMAMALHSPSKLHAKNRGVLDMSKDELHKFASKVKGNKVNKKAKQAIRSHKCN